MAYPTLSPSGRNYTPGDWAQKKYKAMSGAEVRIRYGDQRTECNADAAVQNITDANAALFLADYNENYGTFKSFTLPVEVLAGWSGSKLCPQHGCDEVPV